MYIHRTGWKVYPCEGLELPVSLNLFLNSIIIRKNTVTKGGNYGLTSTIL